MQVCLHHDNQGARNEVVTEDTVLPIKFTGTIGMRAALHGLDREEMLTKIQNILDPQDDEDNLLYKHYENQIMRFDEIRGLA